MEGNKQYILPALAAVVFIVLLVLRNQAPEPAADPTPDPAATRPAPSMTKKAAIKQAIADAGDPTLDDAGAVQSALQPVIERCRASRPEAAKQALSVVVEVIAAEGIGLRVERAEVKGELPADLVGCVREGMLGAKADGIGKTGRLRATLNFEAS